MSEPLIYPWDAETKVALAPRAPQLDQRATKLLGEARYMPAPNTSDEAPPKPKKGYVVKRIDGAWVQDQDHRGEMVYDKETGAEREIGDADIGIPEGMTTEKPGAFDKWDEKRGRWTEDANLKAEHDLETRRAEAQDAARLRVARVDAGDVSAADIAIALGLREHAVSE